MQRQHCCRAQVCSLTSVQTCTVEPALRCPDQCASSVQMLLTSGYWPMCLVQCTCWCTACMCKAACIKACACAVCTVRQAPSSERAGHSARGCCLDCAQAHTCRQARARSPGVRATGACLACPAAMCCYLLAVCCLLAVSCLVVSERKGLWSGV